MEWNKLNRLQLFFFFLENWRILHVSWKQVPGKVGICAIRLTIQSFPGATVVKNPPAKARDATDTGSIPGSGRSPGVGNCNPLQHSFLETSMDKKAWRPTVHGVAKSQTWQETHTHVSDNTEEALLAQS